MNNIIISLTSYGTRLKLVPKIIFSILIGTIKPAKICLTLFKDDVKFIPAELQLLIDNNIVELLVADENIKSHLKYFYCLQKYNRLEHELSKVNSKKHYRTLCRTQKLQAY